MKDMKDIIFRRLWNSGYIRQYAKVMYWVGQINCASSEAEAHELEKHLPEDTSSDTLSQTLSDMYEEFEGTELEDAFELAKDEAVKKAKAVACLMAEEKRQADGIFLESDVLKKYENNCFEIKEKLIFSGRSRVFKSWQQLVPTLTEEAFAEAVKWVCSDPAKEGEKLTREIGLTRSGIVRLKRVYSYLTEIRYEDGRLWTGDFFRVPCSDRRYADKDGMAEVNLKLQLSARDQV